MNEDIIKEIATELNVKNSQIESVLKLLEDGNTIPFIARYRKEATGALDEEQIRKINEYYEYEVNLLKRKEDVIRLIDEKGLLTDEIKNNIMNAKKLVEVAIKEEAVAVAHGCTGKGNDQVRFEVAIHSLAPQLTVLAPVRDWTWSREEEINYAIEHNIPVPIDLDNPFSIDQNLWGRSNECGVLENPWIAPPEVAYDLTASLENTPELIEIEFLAGVPIALDGSKYELSDLIQQLNSIAGKHGVGRIDHIENRLIGIKSREVYEAPGAVTLMTAHKELEDLTFVKDIAHFKPLIEQKITEMIYNGLWYNPLTESLIAFLKSTQKYVNGTVRMKLFKGHAIVEGRKSPNSLYDEDLATYTSADTFNQEASVGFIKLWGLPTKVHAEVNKPKDAIKNK